MRRFKEIMQRWLGVGGNPNNGGRGIGSPYIATDLTDEIAKFWAWYRGDEAGLQRHYEMSDDGVGNTSFWASRSSSGIGYRKVHSGLPALVVDTLTDIVCNDLLGVEVFTGNSALDDEAKIWNTICAENNFDGLLRKAVREALVCGDGAFKISVDGAVSGLPVVEFVSGDRVEFEYKRGRLVEVVFTNEIAGNVGTPYMASAKCGTYLLKERYGYGYVRYELFDEKGREVPLDDLEATASLMSVTFNENVMMAVPLKFDDSARFEGRGKSIFDGKTGLFDGLDEVISQWVDCLRTGRPNVYIPSTLLPRNPHNGAVLRPNGFDSRYIQTQGDMAEGAENRIEVVQPDIKTQALMDSYCAFLDLCLQGIIAPSTIGADISKKRDNAEAQREREKATIYTRNRIIAGVRQAVVLLVKRTISVWEMMNQFQPQEVNVSVCFGEYANPSFEAQVETVGKAVKYGIMSLETAMDELYGGTWGDEEKDAEVERLKM